MQLFSADYSIVKDSSADLRVNFKIIPDCPTTKAKISFFKQDH